MDELTDDWSDSYIDRWIDGLNDRLMDGLIYSACRVWYN